MRISKVLAALVLLVLFTVQTMAQLPAGARATGKKGRKEWTTVDNDDYRGRCKHCGDYHCQKVHSKHSGVKKKMGGGRRMGSTRTTKFNDDNIPLSTSPNRSRATTGQPTSTRQVLANPSEDRARSMFSKAKMKFNDKRHGEQVMLPNGRSYQIGDWYYFPVKVESLKKRKVEENCIMVNPATGRYKLEN